ncbi:MAG: hypothetical protein ACHQD7_04435 [Chitinophagales bacterium]
MKNKPVRQLILFFPCLFLLIQVHAQPVESVIRETFNHYRSGYVQEKLYVHTDKNFYLPGEILWFRIYDVDASFHRPVNFSKLAYVELLDRNNKPVIQQKISLKPGEASGSFIVPANMLSGSYRFRAYTRWMKNSGSDYFFEKTIRIANPDKMTSDSVTVPATRFDIQFFPEGGNLVQNLESKLGFRVTDAYGRGQHFEGLLLDDQSDTLLRFRPLAMGLGHFSFTPSADHRYRAIIRFPDGTQTAGDLPVAYPSGYVMRLSMDGNERLGIAVRVSGNAEGGMVYLFIHTRGSMKKLEGRQLQNGKADFLIDPKWLGDGISQFTVFNNAGKPVCERLYFKYPEKDLSINATTGKSEYGIRNEIQLDLSSATADGQPVPADMSLAVYRLDSLQQADATDIGHYLWLTSDLGAAIESPDYYFENDGIPKTEAMDNLMLTHGWRRFSWDAITGNQAIPIEYAPECGGHILEGKLVDNRTGAPVIQQESYLSVPSTRTQFRTNRSDSLGRVKFEMDNFYGSQEIILQTDPAEDSSCHFEMESPFAHTFTSVLPEQDKQPIFNIPELTDRSVQAQVQHIYHGIKLQQFKMPVLDTSTFYVVPDEKYLLDDYTRFQTMEEVLREYVRSVNVVRKRDKFQLYVFNPPFREFFSGKPLILFDGVPVFEPDKLFHQDPMKIRRLDLVTQNYFLGYKSFEGIVNVTTYRGDLDGFDLDPRATVLDYPGIPEQREFFSPVYETEQEVSSRIPDFRTLLYWTPQIKTGISGKEKLRFFTSDVPGRYAIVVQGITANGEPGSRTIYFTVKK